MATTLREDAKAKEKKGKSPTSSPPDIETSNNKRGPGKPNPPGYVAKPQGNAAKASPSPLPFHHCKPFSNFFRSNKSFQNETSTYVVRRRAPEVPVTVKKASPNRQHSVVASMPSSSSLPSRAHKPAPSSNARAEQLFNSLTAAPKPSPLVPKSSPIAPKPSPIAAKPSPVVPKPTPRVPRVSSVAPKPSPLVPKPSPVAPNPQSVVPKPSSKSVSSEKVTKTGKAVKFQQPLVRSKSQNRISNTPAKRIYKARGTIHPAAQIPVVHDEEVLATNSDSKQEDLESLISDVDVEEELAKIESRILECPLLPLEKLAPERDEKIQDVKRQDETQEEAEEEIKSCDIQVSSGYSPTSILSTSSAHESDQAQDHKEIHCGETKAMECKSKNDDIKEEEQRETQDTAVNNTTLVEKEAITGEDGHEENQPEPKEIIAEQDKLIEAGEYIVEEDKIVQREEKTAEEENHAEAEEKVIEEEKPMEAEEIIAKEENSTTKEEEETSEQEHRRGGPSSSRSDSPVSTNAIEETTGKLMEKRKNNKVLAMAGAIENVISLQKSGSGSNRRQS